jgi:sugar-specific transcriptional regulator TrmB
MPKNIQNSIDIHKVLYKLGFSENEIEVYLKLLELHGSTLTNLSKVMETPRTTVYRAIRKLEEKSIIYRVDKNGKKLIFAEHPKKLEVIYKDKESKIEATLSDYKEIGKDLPITISTILGLLPKDDKNPPIVKIFQGWQEFKVVCERSLVNSTKEVLFISNMDEWKKVFKDDYAYSYYVPKRLELKLYAKTLAIRTKLAEEIKLHDHEYYREMRFLPNHFRFDPTIIISDEEISIMISNKPYSAILIQHKGVTQLLKNFFHYTWDNLSN